MGKSYIQIEVDIDLKEAFTRKLKEEGMTQQGWGLKRVKKFVGPYKKKKKKKKRKE